jgi:hypothetical protein
VGFAVRQFVADYTENNLDGERLASVYTKISRGGQHAAKDGGAGAGERGGGAGAGAAKLEPSADSDSRRRSEAADDVGWE